MAVQSSNFFVLFTSINLKKIQCFSMIPIGKLRNILCQLSNSWRRKVLCLHMNCTSGSHLSSSMSSKNIRKKGALSSSAGVGGIRWYNKNLNDSIKRQKAQICGLSFFKHRKMQVGSDKSTIASHELTCNNSVGFYV